jgi:alpha-glucosidase
MWNDIDLYQAYRDFTTDNVSFPAAEHKAFIDSLHANHQHCTSDPCPRFTCTHVLSDIPIVDAAIAHTINNGTDYYAPYSSGHELDVFIKNPDGSEYIGQVWPGSTVFPDWFAPNTQGWWTQALKNWTALGVDFDGIWLDMNEASSFCTGSCGSSAFASSTKRGLGAAAHPDINVNTPPYS